MGTRLGRSTPKPLTPLHDGRTIQRRQLDAPARRLRRRRRHHRRRRVPQRADHGAPPRTCRFAYNPHYATTNTSKSLLARAVELPRRRRAVAQRRRRLRPRGPRARAAATSGPTRASSASTPRRSPTRRSSTPSTTTATSGSCPRPSSAVSARPWASTTCPARTRPALIEHLDACGDQDYFERGIETAIELEGVRFRPLDISAFSAVEVDFETRPASGPTPSSGAPRCSQTLAAEAG